MNRADPKQVAPTLTEADDGPDRIAELYAELIGAWPRVEENKETSAAHVVPYSEIVRLKAAAK